MLLLHLSILLLLLSTVGGFLPPKAKADVCVPQPAKTNLAVFKLPGEVAQLVPSYSSVAPVTAGTSPPKANAAVCVPAPANHVLLYS
jgi:hypothetical protein